MRRPTHTTLRTLGVVLQLALAFGLLASAALYIHGADKTLAWSPSPDAGIVGYRLHWGEASGNYTSSTNVGPSLEATVTLAPGHTYYFAASAIGSNNLESLYSNEVTYTVPWTAPTLVGREVVRLRVQIPASTNFPPTWEGRRELTMYLERTNAQEFFATDPTHPVTVDRVQTPKAP